MKTRKAEAANAVGGKFLPTRRCRWHPQSEFYVSSLSCIQCAAEYSSKSAVQGRKNEYWRKNAAEINARRKAGRNLSAAVAKLTELVDYGIEYPDAESRIVNAFGVDADKLRAAYKR